MGFRFRKSIKAGPFRLNISKSGIGSSFGVPGFRHTFLANGRTRQAWSLPGTGLSYIEESSLKKSSSNSKHTNTYDGLNYYTKSNVSLKIPKENIQNDFVNNINNCRAKDRFFKCILGIEIISTIITGNFALFVLTVCTLIARFLCNGFFTIKKKYEEDISGIATNERYSVLNLILYVLSLNDRIAYINDNDESECKFKFYPNTIYVYPKSIRYIKSNIVPYVLELDNHKFYFLPNTILVDDGHYFSNINYNGLSCDFKIVKYLSDYVPDDATIVEYIWKHPNKDGGPDKRYADNYEIPICAFGELKCEHSNGFKIKLQLSNVKTIVNLSGLYDALKNDECFNNSEKLQVVNQMIDALVNCQCCPICGDDKIENMKCLKCGHKLENYYNYRKIRTDKSDKSISIGHSILIFIILSIATIIHSGYSSTISNKTTTPPVQNSNIQQKEEVQEKTNIVNANSSKYYYENSFVPLEEQFKNNIIQDSYNDKQFNSFEKKYISIIDKMNENEVEIKDEDYTQGNWIKIIESEGMPYFEPNWQYLKKQYGKYLSPTYNQWLSHLDKTQAIADDASLTIDIDELRAFIIELENLAYNNEGFVAIKDINQRLHWYLDVYLMGMDNSPVFDFENQVMYPEYKQSYEKFLSENNNSKYYSMVEEFYNEAKKHNFTLDDEFDEWRRGEYADKYFNN